MNTTPSQTIKRFLFFCRFNDLESEDFDFYKGLEYLLQHDISEMGYEITFCTEVM